MTDRLAEIEARHAAFERIAADPEARAGYDGSYDAHMDRGWLIAMVKEARKRSDAYVEARTRKLREARDAIAERFVKEKHALKHERDKARKERDEARRELEVARENFAKWRKESSDRGWLMAELEQARGESAASKAFYYLVIAEQNLLRDRIAALEREEETTMKEREFKPWRKVTLTVLPHGALSASFDQVVDAKNGESEVIYRGQWESPPIEAMDDWLRGNDFARSGEDALIQSRRSDKNHAADLTEEP